MGTRTSGWGTSIVAGLPVADAVSTGLGHTQEGGLQSLVAAVEDHDLRR